MDYSKLKVAELKTELTEKGLATTGLKKDLIERLEQFDQDSATAPTSLQLQSDNIDSDNQDAIPLQLNLDDSVKRKHEEDEDTTESKRIRPSVPAPLVEEDDEGDAIELPDVQESTNGHGNGVTVAIEEKELEQTNVMDEWGDSEPIKEDAEPIPAKVDADVETVDSQVDSASPTPIPVTESIYIANLVRPFTVGQLKEALERFGTVVFFWIDPIKSHAYVTFDSVTSSAGALSALSGQAWPDVTGKPLDMIHVPTNSVKLFVEEEESIGKEGRNKRIQLEHRLFNGTWRFELSTVQPTNFSTTGAASSERSRTASSSTAIISDHYRRPSGGDRSQQQYQRFDPKASSQSQQFNSTQNSSNPSYNNARHSNNDNTTGSTYRPRYDNRQASGSIDNSTRFGPTPSRANDSSSKPDRNARPPFVRLPTGSPPPDAPRGPRLYNAHNAAPPPPKKSVDRPNPASDRDRVSRDRDRGDFHRIDSGSGRPADRQNDRNRNDRDSGGYDSRPYPDSRDKRDARDSRDVTTRDSRDSKRDDSRNERRTSRDRNDRRGSDRR